MDPSTEVKIKCNRLYLQKAIGALEELGVNISPLLKRKRQQNLMKI